MVGRRIVLIKGLDGVLPDIRHEENTSPTRTPPEDATARSHFGKWIPENRVLFQLSGCRVVTIVLQGISRKISGTECNPVDKRSSLG
jgi:hypothetical protein